MAAPIASLTSALRTELPTERAQGAATRAVGSEVSGQIGPDFAEAFADAMEGVAASEKKATDMAVDFADGDKNVGIHEVIIASERANVQLRYAVTLKNKLVEAYRDIMNTQV